VTSDERPAQADFVPWTPARVRVTAGLMIAMFVAALDSTVVGTALPTIGRELGDFALYPLIFSGYLLTSTTTVAIWGRLADLFGRRPVLLVGLAIFVGSSVLCGLAGGMLALVVFRALQGVGAGCVQPITLTLVGDLFPLRQRARVVGLFAGVWGIAALVGPLLGALLVATAGWRWIFELNVPVGILSALLLWNHREPERPDTRDGGVDYLGAITLTAGIALLLWGLGAGNPAAQPSWPLVGVAALLLAACLAVELRARHPVLPLDLLRHPLIGPGTLAATLGGAVLFATTTYAPLYVQGGLGGNAFEAGASIAPMSIGWPLASIVGGRIMLRVGYRQLIGAGALVLVIGTLMLAAGPASWGVLWVGAASFVIGVGLGSLLTPILAVVQSAVSWGRRGAVTALNQFSRTIGGAVGVSLLGLLVAGRVSGLAQASQALVASSVRSVFVVILAVSVATLGVGVFILLRGPELPGAGSRSHGPATRV
jgi:EmrB/QacA subfamily drug resistance transporter